jgi:hypothetical protein
MWDWMLKSGSFPTLSRRVHATESRRNHYAVGNLAAKHRVVDDAAKRDARWFTEDGRVLRRIWGLHKAVFADESEYTLSRRVHATEIAMELSCGGKSRGETPRRGRRGEAWVAMSPEMRTTSAPQTLPFPAAT